MNGRGSTRERSLALFVLGLLLFNPPILSLFSSDEFVGDFPTLYLYLFSTWAAFIVLLFLSAGWRDAVRRRQTDEAGHDNDQGE